MTRTGLEPAPRRARRRAVRRDASRRRRRRSGSSRACWRASRREHGTALLRVMLSEGQQPGSLFAPIHWSAREQLGGAHRCAGAADHRPVLGPARRQGDASPHRPCRRQPLRLRAVARGPWRRTGSSIGRARACRRDTPPTSRSTRRPPAGATGASACCRPASVSPTRTRARGSSAPPCCAMGGSRRCSTSPPSPILPSLEWLKTCFDLPAVAQRRSPVAAGGAAGRWRRRGTGRLRLLPGRAQRASRRPLPTGRARVAEIGVATRAGTNCGSCVPELKRLVGAAAAALAAAAE